MNERIQEGNERKNRKTRGGEDKKKPLEREGDERANTGRTNQRKKNQRQSETEERDCRISVKTPATGSKLKPT
jgi:hypothetical protein